ncbi:hypothetical protein AC792_12060 [Arthrobacter sp. RIT-PI-e]|uniref:DUF1684 domain-containing protein n=1 Tax=Arthrobacter sp. RIT-PI-e TaxID=1681197 RepID=UPI000676232A|nr:DUF1684 domain-containing protein [Arthrobacter sp. RIT-PI-e]KNC18374.1 hypothetical protein AC792_12060 [Arthrobacter sp. RIT-PI-e]
MGTEPRSAEEPPEQWALFRARRDEALAEPHGWLTLTSFQWLPAEPAVLGPVPGLWSADGASATVTASAEDGLTELVTAQPLTGTRTATLDEEESLRWVAYGGADGHRTEVELARRGGRYAVRTRDAQAPTLTAFTGVPTFGHRPDLVVPGRFEPYPEPVPEHIRTAHPDVPGTHLTAGEGRFGLPGQEAGFRLHASQDDDGSLDVTFHDSTNGVSTAGWRRLGIAPPGEDGAVVLDFNRAVNYPSAFTPYGTCPLPVPANRVAAPIEAGEKDPLR